MKVKFPDTLKECLASEKSQWRIGDALLREAEAQRDGEYGLGAVATELGEHDLDYSAAYLGALRKVAEAYPRTRRHDLPWKVHYEAGNPDVLDVIARAARSSGKKVTIWFVGDVLRQQRQDAQREHEKQQAAVRKEAEKAAEAARKAREAVKAAENEKEKERARLKLEEANERKKEAEKNLQATKSPGRKGTKPPDESQVSALHATANAKANAGKARKLAEESQKLLRGNIEDLTPAIVAGLTDAAMKAANAWTEVANLVRSTSTNKRGHLSVVNE